MSKEELLQVTGGATSFTSATFINALARGIGACYDIGRSCGSAIRMLITGKRCS